MSQQPQERSSKISFFAVELCIFLAQAAVIFIVVWLASGMFNNEEKFTHLVISKLDANSSADLLYTGGALIFVFGIVAIVRYFSENSLTESISKGIMDEFPRTIYFFGANLTALSFVTGLYLQQHPNQNNPSSAALFGYAILFFVVFFGAGCGLNYALWRKAGLFMDRAVAAASSDAV